MKRRTISKKINRIIDVIAVVLCFIVGVYAYYSRAFQEVSNHLIHVCISLFIAIACVSIVVSFLWLIIEKCVVCMKKRPTSDDFEKFLFNNLNDKNNYRVILVTGKWGAGKTYRVNYFFDKYYTYASKKVFRISCFGLENRKELIDAVNMAIQEEDNSILRNIIELFNVIPIFGNWLYGIFKKKYSYDKVQEGSVFIFDDFERITSRPIMGNVDEQIAENKRYWNENQEISNPNPDKNIDIQMYNEVIRISSNIESIRDEIKRVKNEIYRNNQKQYLDKYVSAAGLINELVDIYNMKVIVVCDTSCFDIEFKQAIFEDKLACSTYIVSSNQMSMKEYANSIIEGIVFECSIEKKKIINTFIDGITDRYDIRMGNLRDYGSLIYAFAYTIQLFDDKEIDDVLLESLFFSKLWAFYSRHENKRISYTIGASMIFLVKTGKDKYEKQLKSLVPQNVRWMGKEVAYYGILGNTQPDIDSIFEEWKSYKYSEVEKAIILGEKNIESYKYEPKHVLALAYIQKDTSNIKWKSYISHISDQYDFGKNKDVNKYLRLYQCGSISYYDLNAGFTKTLFDYIYNETKKTEIPGSNNCSLAYGYEEYIRSRMS